MPVRRLRVALNLRTGMLRNEIVIHGKQAATVCCTISSSYCSMSINELSWSTEQFNRSISLPNFKSILGRHVKVHVNKIILTHWQGCRLQQAALYNLSSGRCQCTYIHNLLYMEHRSSHSIFQVVVIPFRLQQVLQSA